MKPQTPAQGILLQNDWGNAKTYVVECECTDPNHAHTVDISADEDLVAIEIWTTAETPIWSKSRWKLIWELLTKGTVKYNAALIMREQQALNYIHALQSAMKDVKKAKK